MMALNFLRACFFAASLTWITLSPAQSAGVSLPDAANLQTEAIDAEARGLPLLIFFTASRCAYCTQVREEFLLPMLRNPDYARKIVMRQITVSSSAALRDFNGKPSTHREFSKRHRIKLTPTVIVFSPQGAPLSEPLVGLSTPDFYGAYLDRAIDEGLAAMPKRHQ
jgi:thioredoxin-related protein